MPRMSSDSVAPASDIVCAASGSSGLTREPPTTSAVPLSGAAPVIAASAAGGGVEDDDPLPQADISPRPTKATPSARTMVGHRSRGRDRFPDRIEGLPPVRRGGGAYCP